jgi:hypothetical protein
MPRNQISFYATAVDFGEVLSALEHAKSLQYTLVGLFETENLDTYGSYTAIPDFGRTTHPTAIANPTYLVSMLGNTIFTRRVPQQTGGVLYAVDQRANDDTVIFRPGGNFGNDVILSGMVGTVSQSPLSIDLYKLFARLIRMKFHKYQTFFIGREAMEAGKLGARLTMGANSPKEFDLKLTPLH